MSNLLWKTCLWCGMLGTAALGWAQESGEPKAIPLDRQTMLQALDDLKFRTPRLPLEMVEPDPVEGANGSARIVNNARMRRAHLPEVLQASAGRRSDPALTLPYDFSVQLFWIVSRVNNCHYCLGHQEGKLKRAGIDEIGLLNLDTDWSRFDVGQQHAFAFAKKLTFQPHQLTDQDVTQLNEYYSPSEILEIAYLVGRYNATNRWTDALGIPQESNRDFSTELDAQSTERPSIVAPREIADREIPRDLESWLEFLDQAGQRPVRLPVPDSSPVTDRESLPHERLLNQFPIAGGQWLEQFSTAAGAGVLPEDLRDMILFVCAVEDRAAYVQQLARQRLNAAGLDDPQIFQLLSEPPDQPSGLALAFCRKLTSRPQEMTDQDIVELQSVFSSEQIAELVYRVGLSALLNRVTETAGLTWQEKL